jgi:hypothetical protein
MWYFTVWTTCYVPLSVCFQESSSVMTRAHGHTQFTSFYVHLLLLSTSSAVLFFPSSTGSTTVGWQNIAAVRSHDDVTPDPYQIPVVFNSGLMCHRTEPMAQVRGSVLISTKVVIGARDGKRIEYRNRTRTEGRKRFFLLRIEIILRLSLWLLTSPIWSHRRPWVWQVVSEMVYPRPWSIGRCGDIFTWRTIFLGDCVIARCGTAGRRSESFDSGDGVVPGVVSGGAGGGDLLWAM